MTLDILSTYFPKWLNQFSASSNAWKQFYCTLAWNFSCLSPFTMSFIWLASKGWYSMSLWEFRKAILECQIPDSSSLPKEMEKEGERDSIRMKPLSLQAANPDLLPSSAYDLQALSEMASSMARYEFKVPHSKKIKKK